MKMVIDIPEETFKYYATLLIKGEQISNLERIILDGTPLPKHHGRLIDADALTEKAPEIQEYLDVLAPTIIEAEGESE